MLKVAIVESTKNRGESCNNSKLQPCPKCNFPIGSIAGSKEAICKNCGYKDPCCE